MKSRPRIAILLAAATTAAAVLLPSALAGPPLICHPVAIGDAESLPWGKDAFSASKSYSKKSLVADTVRLLEKSESALVHMETLRRATIYIGDDRPLALELQARLMARALDAEAAQKPDALAWFDAGYLAQCCQQTELRGLGLECGEASGVVGYAWVRKAITIGGDDAELEFGAAMVTALAGIPEHERHAARTRELAAEGSLVASNFRTHSTEFWPHFRAMRRG